jgi:hypothetical protein
MIIRAARDEANLGNARTAPPRLARPFVALFLTALVVCPLAGLNPWPFSDWELFSRLRTDRQVVWEAAAVNRAGHERPDRFDAFPRGHRGFEATMKRFSERSAGQRDAICVAWFRAATEQLGPGVRLLRIYNLTWLLSDRRGDRAAPPNRVLAWTCSAKGARAG